MKVIRGKPVRVTFADALRREAKLNTPPRQIRVGAALAAVMLDREGMWTQDLQKGIHVIDCPPGFREEVVGLVKATYAGTTTTPNSLQRLSVATGVGLAIADGLDVAPDGGLDKWLAVALDAGMAVVVVSDFDIAFDPVFQALAPHEWALGKVGDEGLIPAAISLSTGEATSAPHADYADATVNDLRLALRETAAETWEVLRRILTARRGAAGSAAVEADIEAPAAEPLSAPVGRVTERLSEMAGFGPARAWGLRLAQEIRQYREGEIEWADLDKGILLSGPPGCGKSTFARALAAECGVRLFPTSYTEWAGGKESSGDTIAKNLVKKFAEWRKAAHEDGVVVVFVDEIDSMGKRGVDWRSDYWFGPIINAWLAFLDGAEPRTGVIVVAATNYVDRVDDAMRRPGRLERHVELPKPGIGEIAGIIRHHLGGGRDLRDGEVKEAARSCRGRSPADIELLCREAHRIARAAKRSVTAQDLLAALRETYEPPHPIVDRKSCVHEAAHAVVALALGHRLDHVQVDGLSETDGNPAARVGPPAAMLMTADDVDDWLAIRLAGRAAEEVVLGIATAGPAKDLQDATEMALSMHSLYGLGASGLVSIDAGKLTPWHPLLPAVRGTLERCYGRAVRLVRHHEANVLRVADALGTERFLDGPEVKALMRSPLRALAALRKEDEDDRAEFDCWRYVPRRAA